MNEDNGWRGKVFESLSLPALILKPNRVVINVNKIFLKEFGISKNEIIGHTCHEFFYQSKDPCPYETCPLPKVLAEREGQTILRRVKIPGRKEKWEDRIFSPILDDAGEVRYIIEKIRDVTHVKSLERELTGIKIFMEKFVESSISGIIAADRRGKILVMNPAAEELTGYTSQEARNKITVQDLYPPGQAEEVMKKLRSEAFGGKGKLSCIQTILVSAQGEEIPMELTAAIIYEGGKEVATMGIFNDLRGKLAQEEKIKEVLLRAARAEKMASLGQLAAGVAHEINNPLTGILLYGGLLLEDLRNDDPKFQEMQSIIEDANQCRNIVKSLLAYSRQTSANKETLDINDLVEQSLSLIRDQSLFINIEVVKKLSDEKMLIKVDRSQLNQVIINLVINAVDAMERKGTLTLRTYCDKGKKSGVGKKGAAGFAYIEVADTGCGIPEENLPRIFDPFFTTKDLGKGTGLGLSTVYGIIQENSGNIWVKETSQAGTTFIIELPLCQGADGHEL
ncbi:MAG: PAS domain S-box protein [Deltaproteobacteria bacterium]|nr:PAS domain S-box protein [Deltaproteobacteria bacterium]